jgi:cyclopropane fatty-acyl-phospholipid synthase-like methyltransferase
MTAHTARNCEPILAVLRNEFQDSQSVLEIGSGSGQHATVFAADLDYLSWQTSDRNENHEEIRNWLAAAGLPNVLSPLSLDVLDASMAADTYDAVFSANTAHIMSINAVEEMFTLVSDVLRSGGVFCLYGPFCQNGKFNTDSNAGFHASLRARDSAMGIRHLEDLDRFAASGGMRRKRLYAMPANNFLAVWHKA